MKNLAIRSLEDKDLRENQFFSQFKRQVIPFLLSSISILVIGGIVIFFLPNIYVAGSKMEITSQVLFLEDSGQANTGNDQVARRFYSIRDYLLSTNSIKYILKDNELISDDTSLKDIHKQITKFRESTTIDFIQGAVTTPYGDDGKLSIGIEIQYENKSPNLAYHIANNLTNRFLEVSSSRLTEKDNKKTDYLQKQMKSVKNHLSKLDQELASFKNQNVMFLPDLKPITLNRYSELKLALSQIEDRLLSIKQREGEIRSNLATLSTDAFLYSADGARVIGPEEKLTLLEVELANATARFSGNHPDIMRLKREIRELKGIRNRSDTSGFEIELAEAKQQLAGLSEKYSGGHPDVKRLNSKIGKLENLLINAKISRKPKSTSTPNNPAYVRLLTHFESVQDEYKQAMNKKHTLIGEIKAVEKQIQNFPMVQKQIGELGRNREQISAKFDHLEKEYLQAELTRSMNESNLDDRFVLLETPEFPITPSKPHKPLLTVLLVMLSLSTGIAAVLLREALDDRIWGKAVLRQFGDDPVFLIPKFR